MNFSSNNLHNLLKMLGDLFIKALLFIILILFTELFTILSIYKQEVELLKNRLHQATYYNKNISIICIYINCSKVYADNTYYSNSEYGLVYDTSENMNMKIIFQDFNSDLDTVIEVDEIVYIIDNSDKRLFITRLIVISNIVLFIVIYFLTIKSRLNEQKRERKNRAILKSNLESKLQRDLTESLHHEMGTPLAIIKTLLDEIMRLAYPCKFTMNNICNFKINGEKIANCSKCNGSRFGRRGMDYQIANYYEQMRFSIDSLFTLQNLIGRGKKISYSNGTISMFEILNNVITTSNKLRMKTITVDYKNKGILDTYSCRGIQNGEMLIIFNNMVLNSIEANATNLTIEAKVVGNHLDLFITDNGKGIRNSSNEIIKNYNIFNYGYSTKDSNGDNIIIKGFFNKLLYKLRILVKDNEFRGSGLSLSKDILNKNGGDIQLVTTSQSGTKFYLKIPIKVTHNINKEAIL